MALNMENPLQPSPHLHLSKTVTDAQDCIKGIQREWKESGVPVTDDCQILQRFCAKLEYLLQAGLKAKSSLLGGKKDYWNYIVDCLTGNKGLSDGLRFVKSITELKTNLGRGRALIRFCLMHHRLADTIQQCVYNTKVTSDWYHPQSIWMQPHITAELINALYDLNDIQFDLSPHGYDLDASWPSFARKTFTSGQPTQQQWSPPSRSTSISSLASTQDPFMSASVSSFSVSDAESYRSQIQEIDNERRHLQVKLESVEEDRATCVRKIADLEVQLSTLQKTCNQFEVQCDKLETEMKLREESFVEKEAIWKGWIEESGESVSELSAELKEMKKKAAEQKAQGAEPTVLEKTKEAFELTDLKCKLMAEQKTNAALRIEVRSIQMQVQSVRNLDEGKSKLIELLEKKMASLTAKNRELFDLLHKANATPLQESDDRMRSLLTKMDESDKANRDIMAMNTELKSMLSDLEDKSSKVARLAKEKVLKYVEQNKVLQATVDELTKKLQEGMPDVPDGADSSDLRAKLQSLEASVIEKDVNIKQLEAELDGYKQQIEVLKEKQVLPAELNEDDLQLAPSSPIQALKKRQEQLQHENGNSLHENERGLTLRNAELEDLLKAKDGELSQLQQDISGLKTLLHDLEKGINNPEDLQAADGHPMFARVSELCDERAHLKAQLQHAEAQEIDMKKRLETAEQRVTEQEAEIRCISLELADAQTLVSQSEIRVADLSGAVEGKQAEIEGKAGDMQNLKDQVDDLTAQLAESKNDTLEIYKTGEDLAVDLKKMTAQHEAHEKLAEEKERELVEVRTNSAKCEERCGSLEGELSQLRPKLSEMEKLLEDSLRECDELNASQMGLKDERDALQSERDMLQGERDSLAQQGDRLTADLGKMQGDLEVLQVEHTSLQEKNTTLESQVKLLEKHIVSKEEGMSQELDEKLTSLHQVLTQERGARSALESEIDQLRKKHRDNAAQLTTLQEKNSSEKELHQQAIQAFSMKVKGLKKEKKQLEQSVKSVTQDLHAKNESISQLRTMQEEISSRLSSVDEECTSLKREKSELLSAKNTLATEVDNLKLTLEENEMDLEAAATEKSDLISAKNTLATEVDNLKLVLEKKETDLEEAASKEEALRLEQNELLAKITNLEGENEKLMTLKNEFEVSQQELSSEKEKLCIEKQELNAVCDKLKLEGESLLVDKNNLETDKEQLRSELETLEKEKADLVTCKCELEAERDELLTSLNDMRSENEESICNHDEVSEKHVELSRIYAELSNSHEALKCTHGEVIEERDRIDAERRQLETDKDKALDRMRRVVAEIEQMTVERNNLLSSADLLQMKLDQSEVIMKGKDEELAASTAQLDEKEAETKQLFQQLDALETERDMLKKNLEATYVELGETEKELELLKSEQNVMTEMSLKSAAELEDRYDMLTKEKQEVEEHCSQLEVEKKQLEDRLQEHDEVLERTKEELSLREKEVEEKKEMICEMETAMSSAGEEIEEREKCVEDLTAKHEEMESELAALRFKVSTQQIQQQDLDELSSLRAYVAQEEGIVSSLNVQVADLTSQLEKDKQESTGLVEQLQSNLTLKEAKCEELNSLVQQLTESLDAEKAARIKLRKEAEELSMHHQIEVGRMMAEMADVRADNERYKHQIVKVVKDKELLWKQKDQLNDLRKQVLGAQWMDSSEVYHCLKCNSEFSFLVRKHHCRLCGRIFCHACSDNWILTAYSSKKERTCDECVTTHSMVADVVDKEEEKVSDDEDGDGPIAGTSRELSPQTSTPPRPQSVDRYPPPSSKRSLFTAESSSTKSLPSRHLSDAGPGGYASNAPLRVGNRLSLGSTWSSNDTPEDTSHEHPDPVYVSNRPSTPHTAIGKSDSDLPVFGSSSASGKSSAAVDELEESIYDTPAAAADREEGISSLEETDHSLTSHPGSCISQATLGSEAPDVSTPMTEDKQEQDSEAPAAATSDSAEITEKDSTEKGEEARTEEHTDDENYDLITPAEIMESMHESFIEQDPKVTSHGTVHVDQLKDGCLTSESDLWVRPGMSLAIPVIIPVMGYKLHWTFTTEPKDIGFGLTYKDSVFSYADDVEVLIQTIKCNSHKHAIEGELVARRTGIYTLLFDNTHSRFTWKKLEYKLEVQKPDGEVESIEEGPPESQNITHIDDGDLITPPETPGAVKSSESVIKQDTKSAGKLDS